MKQNGGKILGQGTYGCVFHPPIDCIDGSNDGKSGVGKVLTSEHAYIEIAETKPFQLKKNMDDVREFTNPIEYVCDVSKKKTKDFKKCRVLNKDDSKDKKLTQIVYKHKGLDLAKLYNHRRFTFKENIDIQTRFLNVIKGTKSLFESQNKSHLDIKPQNILQTEKNMILIDFGLVTHFDEIYSKYNMNILIHPYPFYPIEFKLFASMYIFVQELKKTPLNDMTKTNEYYEMVDTKMKSYLRKIVPDVFQNDYEYGYGDINDDTNKVMKSFGLSTTLMKNQIYSTWNQILTIMKNKKKTLEYIDDIFTSQAHKVDVFSLGMSLLYYFFKQNQFVNQLVRGKKYKTALECLKKIMQRSLSFNMFERMTLSEFDREYTNYLTHLNVSQTEEILQGDGMKKVPHKLIKKLAKNEEIGDIHESSERKKMYLKYRPSVSKSITHCISNYTKEDLKKIADSKRILVSENKKDTCKRLLHILPENKNTKFNYSFGMISNGMSFIDNCMTKHTVKQLRQIAKENNVKLGVTRKKDICEVLNKQRIKQKN